MRGCRGGVSPCAGLGGSPGAAERNNKKGKEKASSRAAAQQPAMGTAGSRSPKGRHQSFRAGDEVRPRWKRQIRPTPRIAPAPRRCRMAQGERPHPTSLRSPTFLRRGRLHVPLQADQRGNGIFAQPPPHPHTQHSRPASITLHRTAFSASEKSRRRSVSGSCCSVPWDLCGCAVSIAECKAFCPETRFFRGTTERRAAARTCLGFHPKPAQGASPLDPFYAGAFT